MFCFEQFEIFQENIFYSELEVRHILEKSLDIFATDCKTVITRHQK